MNWTTGKKTVLQGDTCPESGQVSPGRQMSFSHSNREHAYIFRPGISVEVKVQLMLINI